MLLVDRSLKKKEQIHFFLLTHTQHSSVDQDQVNQYQFLDASSCQHSQASNHLESDQDHEYKLLYVVYDSYHEYRDGFSYDEV